MSSFGGTQDSSLKHIYEIQCGLSCVEQSGCAAGGCAAFRRLHGLHVLWMADFCFVLLLLYVYWLLLWIAVLITAWHADLRWQTSAVYTLFPSMHFLMYDLTAWCCLTLPALKSTTDHSTLRTMWLSAPVLRYPLKSVIDWVRRPNRLTHAWVSGIGMADWCVGNRTCRLTIGMVALKQLRQSWSLEESDHINVLTCEAVSKPR